MKIRRLRVERHEAFLFSARFIRNKHAIRSINLRVHGGWKMKCSRNVSKNFVRLRQTVQFSFLKCFATYVVLIAATIYRPLSSRYRERYYVKPNTLILKSSGNCDEVAIDHRRRNRFRLGIQRISNFVSLYAVLYTYVNPCLGYVLY